MEMEEGLVGPYQAPEGRRGGERCRGVEEGGLTGMTLPDRCVWAAGRSQLSRGGGWQRAGRTLQRQRTVRLGTLD